MTHSAESKMSLYRERPGGPTRGHSGGETGQTGRRHREAAIRRRAVHRYRDDSVEDRPRSGAAAPIRAPGWMSADASPRGIASARPCRN